MNELTVLVEQSGEIKFNNFEEIKKNLAEKMFEYKGAIFTDESIPIAKKEVASLRNLCKEVDSKRKAVKAAYMVPYTDFEAKVKELTALINEPITLIDDQIKDYTERQREEKRENIKAIYEAVATGIEEYIPLEKIYDSRWENKTTKVGEIESEIYTYANNARQAVSTLKSMNSKAYEKAIAVYKNTLSIADAIQVITQYELQKTDILKKEQERKQQEEIERIRKEERARVAEEERIKDEERKKVLAELEAQKAKEQAAMAIQQESVGEKKLSIKFSITAYPLEIEQIEMYLDSIGVEYERMM